MKSLSAPDTLDHLVAQVSRLHHQRAHELFTALGLYRGQPPVLHALWERDGQTGAELGERLLLDSATMSPAPILSPARIEGNAAGISTTRNHFRIMSARPFS